MAVVELTHRNTRRYGGYVVHMGIVLMFIGFAGAAFNRDTTEEVKIGDSIRLGAYELKIAKLDEGRNPNYSWHHAAVEVYRDGRRLDTLHPERRFYFASEQTTSEVAIRRQLNHDLYLNFAGISDQTQNAVIQVYIFPLVSWIWIGSAVLFFGTILCLIPSKIKLQYARTEVVGVARQQAPVRQQ
jgi:cytochrome c-type biogenesis protein CcmF